jgi:hypothetical protein
MTAPSQQPRFKIGDTVVMDSGDYRFTGREFTVREIVGGKYQLAATDGGHGVKDVDADMLLAPGEPLKSTRWLHVGTIIRYTGSQVMKYKTTVILAPGDLGVVIGTKGNKHGGVTTNVARYGGLPGDMYARLDPRCLDVVPVTDDVTSALTAAATSNGTGP